MIIVSYVCAIFRDRSGTTILTIHPSMLNHPIDDVPETIREDPLFNMMLLDGSLQAVKTIEQQKALESDPLADINAEGKKTVGKAAEKKGSKTKEQPDVPAEQKIFPAAAVDSEKTDPVPVENTSDATEVMIDEAASAASAKPASTASRSAKKAAAK